MKYRRCAIAALGLATSALPAQDAAPTVTWAGYVDAYYAYDLGRPATLDRAFTTQPARANEFNVNLAFVEANLSGDGIRGRLALQAGTSVQSNYAAEPSVGSISGGLLSRHLQEAYVGLRLAPTLWVDAGIFFSNVGVEAWIPSDNLALTRSLTADFSPYYSTGVRAMWQASPHVAFRLDIVNGWQNISETNTDKGVGTRIDVTLREGLVASQYAFVGNEVGQLRLFGGVGLSGALSERTAVAANVDAGQQDGVGGADADHWFGGALTLKRRLTSRAAVNVRAEWYNDPAQVIIATGVGQPGFRATGGSLGLDVAPRSGVLWRNELRVLQATDALFPDRAATSGLARQNVVLTSALALRF
jgi:hypothetical protein